MGLDGVELIMAIEEEFKIAISDSEASQSDTVGKVVDIVHGRLRHNAADPCPSQHGFYVVRKNLVEQFGLARSAVKPGSVLAELVPEEGRPVAWDTFMRNLTGDKYPSASLVRPKWLNRIVVLLLPGTAFFLPLVWIPPSFFWLGFFPALLVLVVGDRATTRWKTFFPSAYSQVKDLVPFVKTLDSRIWSKEEVFDNIREISVEILGVKPEQVKLEAHWVNDLGVG